MPSSGAKAHLGGHPGLETPELTLTEAIRGAKARFHKAGVRWTSTRERALQLLLDAREPVKPYDLISGFKVGSATAPPTVYRALDALVEMGLAHRIPSINAYIACRHQGGRHAASFLICEICHGVEEIAAPSKAILATVKESSSFRVAAIVVEVYGRCLRCQRLQQPLTDIAPPAPSA
jgi:Fur family zinc uptake transcriptional regulator